MTVPDSWTVRADITELFELVSKTQDAGVTKYTVRYTADRAYPDLRMRFSLDESCTPEDLIASLEICYREIDEYIHPRPDPVWLEEWLNERFSLQQISTSTKEEETSNV